MPPFKATGALERSDFEQKVLSVSHLMNMFMDLGQMLNDLDKHKIKFDFGDMTLYSVE